MMNGAGLEVARALALAAAIPAFVRRSVQYTDGPDGREGGIGILRAGPADSQQLLLMKYTSHGLSHGHYDKLHFLLYDGGREIVQDYGAVRFINVEPKFGGRYLPETRSWAMQTIAHNTVTVDEQSHYQGTMAVAERYHADPVSFSASDPSFQVMTARVDNAYSGVHMQRTMAMVTDSAFVRPVVIDLFRVESAAEHQYDLPLYYMGHLIHASVKYTAHTGEMRPLGTQNGYQHLWVEAEGKAASPVQLSWLNGERYYTLTAAAATFILIGQAAALLAGYFLWSSGTISAAADWLTSVFAQLTADATTAFGGIAAALLKGDIAGAALARLRH